MPTVFDHRCKNYPAQAPALTSAQIGAQGWHVLGDDLPLPQAVLDEEALAHNTAWMQAWAQRQGVVLAPHGKTTLSPELLRRQLDAGAWGLSFANAWQAQLGVAVGAQRILIANQVLQAAELDALDALCAQHPEVELWFLVDSLEQQACLERWQRERARTRVWNVLLELGFSGGRSGCRTLEGAQALARALHASPAVRLCGIECYEGLLGRCDSTQDSAAVTQLVHQALALVRWCDAQALWHTPAPASEDDGLAAGITDDRAGQPTQAQVIVSAGGSALFDLVLPLLRGLALSRPVQGVLRSGCYLTHDHGHYHRYWGLVAQRQGWAADPLRPALCVWALVQSVPEPGLALLGCGRRDISYDIELPLPQAWARAGQRQASAAPRHWHISALNDQHAYLRFDASSPPPQVGDRVALGLSHPCTTFDKWNWMLLASPDGRVTGAVSTWF